MTAGSPPSVRTSPCDCGTHALAHPWGGGKPTTSSPGRRLQRGRPAGGDGGALPRGGRGQGLGRGRAPVAGREGPPDGRGQRGLQPGREAAAFGRRRLGEGEGRGD